MKALKLLSLSLILTQSAFAATAPTQVDVNKVNQVINDVVKETFTGDELIESLLIKLDPSQTQIDDGKINATLAAKVKTTPWEAGAKSKVGFNIATNVAPKDENSVTITGAFKFFLNTNVSALVRYASAKGITTPTDPSEIGEEAAKKLDALAERLKAAQNLNEVRAIADEAKATLLASKLAEEQKQVIRDIEIRANLQGQTVKSLKIVYTKPIEFDFFAKLVIKDIGVSFGERNLNAGLAVSLDQDKAALAEFVAEGKKALLELQEKNEAAIESLKSTISGYAQFVRDFLQSA